MLNTTVKENVGLPLMVVIENGGTSYNGDGTAQVDKAIAIYEYNGDTYTVERHFSDTKPLIEIIKYILGTNEQQTTFEVASATEEDYNTGDTTAVTSAKEGRQ